MPYTAIQVANEFLRIARKKNKEITPMKIQKLVYFAHGWNLALFDKPLIDEQVEAWKYGPVINSLYHEFKSYGNQPIKRLGTEINWEKDEFTPPEKIKDSDTLKLIKKIWEVYGKYTPFQLSVATHKDGTPWEKTYKDDLPKGTDIDQSEIKTYFTQLAAQ